ncbi:hypothetical protein Goarm_014131, partial [Gossypium armourianum]|nr:hypothetical protein [Gossypium armourianum]
DWKEIPGFEHFEAEKELLLTVTVQKRDRESSRIQRAVRVLSLKMTEVRLHIYDVTNSGSDKTNSTIVQINKIFKDGIGLGGIFHSAVQVYGEEEWSFGFCEQGSGVFSCPSGKNPMYTYRESMVLGITNFSKLNVNQILQELSREWPGSSYDLLSKNCNHFCDEFCERLGVQKLPGWVNRFANAGDAAIEIAENTALRLRQAKTEIVSASKVAYRFLVGVTSSSSGGNDSPGNSNRGSPRFQAAWFKNIITTGAKPSSSSEIETQGGSGFQNHRLQNSAHTMQQNFQDPQRSP